MNKTKIEWVVNPDGTPGYTWNPITGCLNNCEYCYGKTLAKRFNNSSYKPAYHPERYAEPFKLKKHSTIFVGSVCDMFGDWIDKNEVNKIKFDIRHNYLLLTKNPKRYQDYIPNLRNHEYYNIFWRGISLDDTINEENQQRMEDYLQYIKNNRTHSFVSLEPLLCYDYNVLMFNRNFYDLIARVNWIIIGALTVNGKPQRTVNFSKVLDSLKTYHYKIFVKDSVYKLYPDLPRLRAIPYNE